MIKKMNEAEAISKLSDSELSALYSKCYNNYNKLDKLQLSLKTAINSLYGCVGSTFFRYFNRYQAEGVTFSGQGVVQTAENEIDAVLKPITGQDHHGIAMDTDSVYINVSGVVKKSGVTGDTNIVDYLDKFGSTTIQSALDAGFDVLAKQTNAMKNFMYMKRESIGNAVFVAKKNYCILVHDKEGVRYKTPTMSVTGLEAIKSGTPKFFREHLMEGYEIAFKGSENILQTFVEDTSTKFRSLPIDQVSSSKSVTSVDKWDAGDAGHITGAPGHVKAVLAYNKKIEALGLTGKYRLIGEGDKFKMVLLKVPNPVGNKSIAYVDELPPEFGLESYIDYDSQIEAFFVKPLQRVFDQLGWKPIYSPSLDGIF